MDVQKFLNAQFSPRELSVDVPELADWFDGDPQWIVRGLTAAELGRADEASTRGRENIKALIEAMAGNGDKAKELRKTMGLSDKDVPADVSRRIEMLTMGSVEPQLGFDQRDVAVKLAESFPTTFYALTNHIVNLTGKGSEVGKPKPSGKTPKSK